MPPASRGCSWFQHRGLAFEPGDSGTRWTRTPDRPPRGEDQSVRRERWLRPRCRKGARLVRQSSPIGPALQRGGCSSFGQSAAAPRRRQPDRCCSGFSATSLVATKDVAASACLRDAGLEYCGGARTSKRDLAKIRSSFKPPGEKRRGWPYGTCLSSAAHVDRQRIMRETGRADRGEPD